LHPPIEPIKPPNGQFRQQVNFDQLVYRKGGKKDLLDCECRLSTAALRLLFKWGEVKAGYIYAKIGKTFIVRIIGKSGIHLTDSLADKA
jgi:hypothetical protein